LGSKLSEEILVNTTPYETRIAIVENSVLKEVHIERANKLGIVGNIYKGLVVRVLPGMQAAFIDIGLSRAAFLHADDIHHTLKNCSNVANTKLSINDKIAEGQEIIVQVMKDPIGNKGAKLTTQLTFASRNLVFMPGSNKISVSLKIEDELERERLKNIFLETVVADGGYIIRTAAEGVKSFVDDVNYLKRSWSFVQQNIPMAKVGSILHEEPCLLLRLCRDFLKPDSQRIRIDNLAQVERVQEFVKQYIDKFSGSVEYYDQNQQIFDLYSIEDEINKAIHSKIQLKSGGYLVFDLTEAMTVIDVNTGAFVGKKSLEDTIFKTNLEAARAIARQLLLRNIGGIIIVDFIDMKDEEHRRQVLRVLEQEFAKDKDKTTISEITSLGLVQITRKRTRESLEQVLCEECPTCNGHSTIKTIETVCYEIFREILRVSNTCDSGTILVIAASSIIEKLNKEDCYLHNLQRNINKVVNLQVENMYLQEQFKVVLL
jgi:ribonuclease G